MGGVEPAAMIDTCSGETSVQQISPSPQEFWPCRGPMSFNTNGSYFSTDAERTGQGEAS